MEDSLKPRYWDTKNKPFFIDFYEPYELEVIGNIYETPELLEGKE